MQLAQEKRAITIADGFALRIVAAERMGLSPAYVDIAKLQLSGTKIHPMLGAAMEREARAINARLSFNNQVDVGNKIVSELVEEYGLTE